VVLVRLGKARYGLRHWDALSRCVAIRDLGRQFGDFSVPGCNELDGDSSEVCRRSENSAKLVSFRIRGPVK
jgi:hypothetical protein